MTDPASTQFNKRAAVHAFSWSLADKIVSRAAGFLGFVVLARLLEPEDFGLLSLAFVAVGLVGLFGNLELPTALVREPHLTDKHVSAALTVGVTLGAALGLALVALSMPISKLLQEDALVDVLILLAANLPLSAAQAVPTALWERRLDYRRIAVRNTVAQLFGLTVAIVLAAYGAGVIALAAQLLAASVVALLLVLPGSGVRLVRFQRRDLYELLAFSRALVGINLLYYVSGNLESFVIASALGTRSLGLYNVAGRIPAVLRDLTVSAAAAPSLSAYSLLQAEPARLLRAHKLIIRETALLAGPALVGLALCSPAVVPLMLGDKYVEVGLITAAAAVAAIGGAVTSFDRPALLALGRSSLEFKLVGIAVALQAIGLGLAAPFGLEAVALAAAVRSLAFVPLRYAVTSRALGTTTGDLLAALLPAITASVLVLAIAPLLAVPAPPALKVAVFGAAVAVITLLVSRRAKTQLWGIARRGVVALTR